jgi:hypothetical protein
VTGHHPAGEQDRHTDAFGRELLAQRLGEAHHRELARLVRTQPHRRREHARRRGEHDAPEAAPGAHDREELAHGADRPEHVDVDHPRPVLLGQAIDRTELLHSHVGAEHVATAERGADVLGGGRHRRRVTDVDARRRRLDPQLGDRGGSCRGRFRVDVEHADLHASTRERARHRRSQTGSGAGHHRDAAGELRHGFPSRSWTGPTTVPRGRLVGNRRRVLQSI